jgi:hypothetical protein
MPEYLFKNKETNEEWLEWMGISEADEYLLSNPHIERMVHGAPAIGYRTGIKNKPDDGFRDVLKRVKKANRGSNINTF